MTLKFPKTMLSAAALIVSVAATPTHAVVTTFAQFSPTGPGANVSLSNIDFGTNLTLFTNGSRQVSFSFLQAGLAPFVTNASALFSLNAASGSPALRPGGFLIQPNIAGSFSFTSTSVITVGSTTYAAGSNFLTGTFANASIFGREFADRAAFSASTAAGNTLTYSSDFLDFSGVNDRDFSVQLNGLVALVALPGSALSSLSGVASGTFSSDPAPAISAIPEPMTWTMMISGFGLVGCAMRSRRQSLTNAICPTI